MEKKKWPAQNMFIMVQLSDFQKVLKFFQALNFHLLSVFTIIFHKSTSVLGKRSSYEKDIFPRPPFQYVLDILHLTVG